MRSNADRRNDIDDSERRSMRFLRYDTHTCFLQCHTGRQKEVARDVAGTTGGA